MAPNRYRDVRYADDGTVAFVTIEDTITNEILKLDMQKRTATLIKEPSGQFGHGLPFENVTAILQNESIEFVGQQEVDGVKTNVFRHHRKFSGEIVESNEIWIDAKSKQLMKVCTTPGDDYFDPQTDADRDSPAEQQLSKGTIAGVIRRNIVFDAQVNPSLFSLTPPAGFTIVESPQRVKVTEERMIQWLRLSAEANGGVFLELERGFNMAWHNAIGEKPETERTETEKKYLAAWRQNMLEGNRAPVRDFIVAYTAASSFRYMGKGVQLGDKDQIVCFYKLRSTGSYRAVYGDLRVAEVNVSDLPLPVE